MNPHSLASPRRWSSRLLLCLGLAGGLVGCGTGSGDTAVCQEPPPPSCSAQSLVSAVDLFSRKGCYDAIDNTWCGVNAQALAECLQNAQVCIQSGATREVIAGVLAAGVCAAEFEEWDGCFGNGDTDSDGGDDDWD